MKCRYCSSDVPKEESIKDGGYYHKHCHKEKMLKKEIEEFYIENMKPTTLVQLRKAIKQILDKNIDAEYILWTLKDIKTKNKILNSPFGIIGYCMNVKNEQEFKKHKVNSEFKKIDKEFTVGEVTTFKYNPSSKRITDII